MNDYIDNTICLFPKVGDYVRVCHDTGEFNVRIKGAALLMIVKEWQSRGCFLEYVEVCNEC